MNIFEWFTTLIQFLILKWIFRQGSKDWTQEPWIGPFFTFKKTAFPKVQWVCLKALGPIQGFNI